MARLISAASSTAFRRGGGHLLSIFSAAPIPGLTERPNVTWLPAPAWTARPISRFAFGALYFRFLWPHRNDFDAVYYAGGSFDISMPSRTPKIVAFQNMLPFDLEARRRYHWGWQRLRHWLLRYVQAWAFKRADLVIFISEYARGAIDAVVPNRRGESVVIPHGVTATRAPLDPVIAAKLPERFVLYLSILDAYKAQVELVEAWGKLRSVRPVSEKLVFAGADTTRYATKVREAIARLKLKEEVILLGNVPHDQISDLAGRAVFNVFLSSCENCPNILLELMCVGSPLLVSAREPMPELGGPGLDYVEPYDVDAIVRGLERMLDDPAHREATATAALERSGIYSWRRAGERTWRAILAHAGAAAGIARNKVAEDRPTP